MPRAKQKATIGRPLVRKPLTDGAGTRNERRTLAKAIETALATHPCGTCNVCCTVKAVEAIGKPEHTPCEHLSGELTSGGACSIYKERPDSCRDYFCSWRYGFVGDSLKMRPDRLGLVFDVAEAPPPGVLMLSVREFTPGAIDAAMITLNELVAERGYVLYLLRGDKRHFMGPEEKVRACHEWSRRHLPLVAR